MRAPDHVLAGYKEVSFEVLNGYNFLLGTRLGFWDDMCREENACLKVSGTDGSVYNGGTDQGIFPALLCDGRC